MLKAATTGLSFNIYTFNLTTVGLIKEQFRIFLKKLDEGIKQHIQDPL